MPTITTRYITYNRLGGGIRRHNISSLNTIESFPTLNVPVNAEGDRDAFGPATWISADGTAEYTFAFLSLAGAKGGSQFFLTPGSNIYEVGAVDITITVLFVPIGGDGPPSQEIWVDAFNADSGGFSDDLAFIQVLTPPTPPDNLDSTKTDLANYEGVVSNQQAQTIRASEFVDGGVPFLKWIQILMPKQEVNDREFALAAQEQFKIWFAVYQTPARPVFDLSRFGLVLAWAWIVVIGGLMITPGGVSCPVCGPYLSTLAGISLVAIGITGLLRNAVNNTLNR